MYVYKILPKYTWNIYVFITYKIFKNVFSKLIVSNKKQKYTFCHGQK